MEDLIIPRVVARLVDGRIKLHIDLKFNPNHGPDGRFTTYGSGGRIQTPGGESPHFGPGGKPSKPTAPKYSKMSGEELAKELQSAADKRDAEKKEEAKERKKLKTAYKQAQKEREGLPTVGSAAEIEAARDKWNAECKKGGKWDSTTPEAKAVWAELNRLRSPKDAKAAALADKKVSEAGKASASFEDKVRAKNKAAKEQFHTALTLDKEDRASLDIRGDKKLAGKTSVKKGIARYEELVSAEALGERSRVYIENAGRERAFYRDSDGSVHLESGGGRGIATVVHELGHHLEHASPAARHAAVMFRREKTVGSPTKSLKTVSKAYDRDEIYKERSDGKKWIDPYMGKIYRRGGSTELLSMGLEMLATKPDVLLKKDPELFALVVNAARGKL